MADGMKLLRGDEDTVVDLGLEHTVRGSVVGTSWAMEMD
jgi:hypothetical protein